MALKKTPILLLLLISHTLSYQSANADQQVLFRHLNTQDGLAQNTVLNIHQDRHGFMWFATANGVSRYDGYQFQNYYSYPNSNKGLSHHNVHVILEDHDGILWFGTDKGLNRLDPESEQFSYYFAGDGPKSIVGDSIRGLAEIGNELWVGTTMGVSVIDLSTGISRTVDIDGATDREIWSIVEDADGGIWLAAMNGGVWNRKAGQQKWQAYWPFVEDKKNTKNAVRTVLIDGDWVWLGTMYGLNRLSRSSGVLEPIILDPDAPPNIFGLTHYNGQLWVATYGQGLYRYDLATAEVAQYLQSSFDPYAISSNYLMSLYRDKENRLWLGGSAAGVNYDKLGNQVYYYRHVAGDENSLLSSNVSSIVQAGNQLMFAVEEGINVYDLDTGRYLNHSFDRIITLYAGPYGENWASGQNGVYKLSDTGIAHIDKIDKQFVVSLLQLDSDQLLVGTLYGLWVWNEATELFQEINLVRSSHKSYSRSAAVEYLFRRANRDVLIGTQAGIYVLNIKSFKVASGTGVLQLLNDKHITYMLEDENHFLWVGTEGEGLFKLDETGIVAHYSRINGMPDDSVRGIVESGGYLWVSTDRGIVSIKEFGEHKGSVHRYQQRFLSGEFNSGAVYRMQDGQLLFGGVFGAVRFAPEDVLRVAESSRPSITGVKLFNHALLRSSDAFSISDSLQKQLTLRHDQNIFSLDFSAFDYDRQGLIYAYRLSGVQGADWIVTDDNNRRVTFTDLSAGEYLFEVKAGLNEHDWGGDVTSMPITILPPWWQTTLAYIIYVLLSAMAILSYIRLRTLQLKKRALHLEELVDQRTQEVQSQNETIERLLDKKNEMFANISHELRTPITLIAGPVDQVLDHPGKNNQIEMLRLAQRNIKRLNVLVDQLLQLSRLYYVSDEQKVPQCISKIANAIIVSFESIAHLKGITLERNIKPDVWVQAVPNAMDSLLINLLSNAFKYTEPGGVISIELLVENQLLQLAVKDTGVGIPKEQFDHIFERFTRLDSNVSDNPEGVGVGLALVKQLLELHDGKVQVISTEGEGSCFEVALPLIEPPVSENEEALLSDSTSRQLSDIAELYVKRSVTPEKLEVKQESVLAAESSKPNLLIIDDIEDMRAYLHNILSVDFECSLASSGEEGLELAMELMPDVVLCDVMMPGMDGFEVLDKMRDDMRCSHIPILMLTAKGDRESKIKGWAKLADDYIVKPFDADELRARLQAVLEIRRLQQQQLNQVLHSQGAQDESLGGISTRDQVFLEKLQDALQAHFDDPEFKLEQLAERIHLSARSLQKKTKALLGKSPKQYLREYRLKRAMEMLCSEKLTVAELTELVGFSSDAYFIKCFKAHTGQTPIEYRQKFIK